MVPPRYSPVPGPVHRRRSSESVCRRVPLYAAFPVPDGRCPAPAPIDFQGVTPCARP